MYGINKHVLLEICCLFDWIFSDKHLCRILRYLDLIPPPPYPIVVFLHPPGVHLAPPSLIFSLSKACKLSVFVHVMRPVLWSWTFCYGSGFADPYHWVMDSDPALFVSGWQDANKKKVFFQRFLAHYFLHLHQFSKVKSKKEVKK
jgi:hypothetical protein